MTLKMKKYKALIFDLDDTLIPETKIVLDTFRVTCTDVSEEFNIPLDFFINTVKYEARKLWHQAPERQYCLDIGTSSWEGLWSKFEYDDSHAQIMKDWIQSYKLNAWANGLAQLKIADKQLASELACTFETERRERHFVFDDTLLVLDYFKETYQLAILTNGQCDLQREKISGSGIEDYFHFICASGDIGIGKPDACIFEYVLENMKVDAAEALMIGNNPKSDILGANRVGIDSVWFDFEQKELCEAQPTHTIHKLGDLIDLL